MLDSPKNDVFIGTQSAPGAPKGLVDAISEIQQYYVVERTGSTIPEDFFTLGGKLAFFEVGFKGGFLCGLVSALMTPIFIGVVEEHIPIFGSSEPSFYDNIFAFLIAVSFTLGYTSFYATLGRYYLGELAKAAVKNLVAGLVAGAILKFVIVFIAYHFMYFIVFDPVTFGKWLLKFECRLLPVTRLDKIYQFFGDFRHVFLTSAYFMAFTTILTIAIPIIGITLGAKRMLAQINQEEKWKAKGKEETSGVTEDD